MCLFLTPEEKNKLAEENFNIIHYVAKSFSNTGLGHDELVSIGSVGFVKALNTYTEKKGAKFSTYAVACVRNEILHFLRKEKKHVDNTVLSGNAVYSDGEGGVLTIEDTLSNEMNNEAFVEDIILLKEDIKVLMEAIEQLSERDQFIIKNRYGIGGGQIMTQEEIGRILGMSQANISKLEQGIIAQLNSILKGKVDVEDTEYYSDYESKE